MKKYLLVISFLLSLVAFSEDAIAQKATSTKQSYSFGGHVFTGDFPIVLGKAVLYDALKSEVIETVSIDTLGYYKFYRKPAADYIVVAGLIPGDPNFGLFSYTFYPNAIDWQDGDIIHLTETNWEYDIKLIQHSNGEILPIGPGIISGTINQEAINKPAIEDVDVILYDEDMSFLMHIPTNHLGQFSFENLDYGAYIIYPQIVGMITKPIIVTISAENTTHENIEISLENGYISSTINEALISEASFNFYPNPASSLINIEFSTTGNKNIQTRISDISGRVVYEESSKLVSSYYSNTLQVRNWQNGSYFVEIFIDGALASTQKLVISH